NVDHSKLCPFCDQPLPEQLSPEFHDLLRNAIKRAVNRPRPSNRFGLKASLPIYIGVCERHRFEEKLLPQAIKAGWPTTIDFNAVPRRLLDQRKLLKDILQNPSTSSFFRDSLEHVQAVGLRVAESAMGQYATFERIQPGYYGERGSIVIHQTLFTMFSPEVMLAAQPNFAPLSQHTFTHAVLVPEAALLLIQQDQRTPREAALKTMRASSRFGALMFPDDDD
ncbi:RTC4-like domain-containing protein, partial [Auriculariales sp. MPI-PUGE-AT-0066]